MSRLFDALKSLESETAGHDTKASPMPYQKPFQQKKGTIWTKPLFILVLFLTLGLVTLYVFQKWGKPVLEFDHRVTNTSSSTIKSIPKALPPAHIPKKSSDALIDKETTQITHVDKSSVKIEQQNNLKKSSKKTEHSNLVHTKQKSKKREITHNKLIPIQDKAKSHINNNNISSGSKPRARTFVYQNLKLPDVLPRATQKRNNGPDYRRLKNILLIQAEEYRKAGKWNLALKSYKKVWSFSKEPTIANNYAAVLIMLGKYREALTILKEALKLAPDDEDIKRNLQIAQKKFSEQSL